MARRTREIWALDSETDPFKKGRVPKAFIWGAYNGKTEQYEEFSTVVEVVRFFETRNAVVYAHNGGKFDYHTPGVVDADAHPLREFINSDDPIMIINGRLAKFKIGIAEFRDSMNLFTAPLRDYEKMQIDYSIMEEAVRHLPQNWEQIRRYLRSDCISLWNLVNEFFRDYGRSFTQAGSAMRVWSKMSGVPIPKQTAIQYERYAPFYYGGRVQCFQAGVSNTSFSVVDINSAYPFAMLSAHPISTDAIHGDELPPYPELSKCFVRLDAVSKGAFPYRYEGKLYFPDDERTVREYWITGWELLAALETDTCKVIRIKDVWKFPITIDFKQYVNHFYELRMEAARRGDKARKLFGKIFMNSLYGKFGANPANYQEFLIASTASIAGHMKEGFIRARDWGERFLMVRNLPEEKHRYYNIATAASVTGFVRAYLWRAILQCSGVLYCDTDSIDACSVSGLQLGSALGQWKVEMECDKYAIAGKKLYAKRDKKRYSDEECEILDFEKDAEGRCWKTACKGVDLRVHEILDVASGKSVVYNPEVPTYSVHRPQPIFMPRTVRRTYKDIRSVPDVDD